MAKRRRSAAAARKPRKAKASSPRFPKASPYLKKLSTAVHRHFAKFVDLPTFLCSAGQLAAEDRKLIVRQPLILLDQNYAHLPQAKLAFATEGMTRLDVYLGERPIQSLDLKGGRAAIVVPKNDGPQATLEVRGFNGTQLVARYRTPV